jgi:hypothetical protein
MSVRLRTHPPRRHNDAPLIGEHAARLGRSVTEGGERRLDSELSARAHASRTCSIPKGDASEQRTRKARVIIHPDVGLQVGEPA